MKAVFLSAALLCAASPAWPRAGGGGGGGGGGCFPAGTAVLTLEGGVPIEKVRPGDTVLAYTDERLVKARVENFIEKKDRLIKIRTKLGTLTATPEHPLLTRYGFTEVRDLKAGDSVAMMREGRVAWARIRSLKPAGVAEVFNLEVAPPHTFIADGFIVHNKGGFGGGGFGRSYSRGYYDRHGRRDGPFDYAIYAFAAVILLIKGISRVQEGGGGSSSRAAALPSGSVAPRARLTREIMQSLASSDRDFDPQRLDALVRDVFLKAQAAWQARDYSSMRGIMLPYLHASHSAKVESMRARGETNMMENVTVHGVDFVHVRCPAQKEGRAFTALVSASARDYTISDGTGSLISGSREDSPFQEFWTFHQFNGAWALARIDQVGEMDFINAPNLPDRPGAGSFAAGAVQAAAAAAVMGAAGHAAPPRHTPEQAPLHPGEDPFERGAEMLRKTAGTQAPAASPSGPRASGHFDRQKMEIAATLAFESVYTAWGRNDPSLLNSDFVSAEALGRLKRLMEARKAEGLSFELKDLFTRRAEVVMSTPAARSKLRLDEFTARINATAVRGILRNGKPLHRDEAPEPFTEYWVFGRQNESWKLRDILPRMDQSGEDRTKDGAPGPAQIEWYWTAAV